MDLCEIFPADSLRAKFSQELAFTNRERSQLREIAEIKRSCMVEIGAGAWDRYVQTHPMCDSLALAEYFQRDDPKIYLAMERHTGFKVLKDISYTVAEIEDDSLEHRCASELLTAVVWPGVLRISDVTFANPYMEIPESVRKYRFQEYEGLGLFPELMENAERYCRESDLGEMCLAAAYIDLVPFFRHHGFEIEDTPAGRASLEVEHGIPMAKQL